MKVFFQRLGLVLFGLALAWLLVEAVARFAGLAEPLRLGADFDRSPSLYLAEQGREHPWSTGDDEGLAIAMIGDSLTAGSGVQQDDAYPARLERLLNLNEDTPPVEVRTYARSGTNTHYQLRFLRRALVEKPDLVLLGVFVNDAEDLEIINWRDVVLPRVPTGWRADLLRASHSLAWLYQRLEHRRIQRAYTGYLREIYHPDFPGWERFNRALGVFAGTCHKEEVPLVAIVLPSAGSLGPEYPFDFVHEKIHGALAAQQIPYFDLLKIFRNRSPDRLSVLPGVDGHFNEIGHRMVAEAVLGYLLRADHIPAAYAPRLVTPQGEEHWLWWLHKLRSAIPAPSPSED